MKKKAIKKDSGKSRVDLVNPSFIEDMGSALGYGASYYSDFNYREGNGLDKSRLYASAMRHLLKYAKGIEIDDESGINHLTAVAVNVMMIYTLEQDGKGGTFNVWRQDLEKSPQKNVRERRKRRRKVKVKGKDKKARKRSTTTKI